VDGSLAIRQQASLRATRLGPGESIQIAFDPARRYWLHVAQGEAALENHGMQAGDALGFVDEGGTHVLTGRGTGVADVLLFDLPA